MSGDTYATLIFSDQFGMDPCNTLGYSKFAMFVSLSTFTIMKHPSEALYSYLCFYSWKNEKCRKYHFCNMFELLTNIFLIVKCVLNPTILYISHTNNLCCSYPELVQSCSYGTFFSPTHVPKYKNITIYLAYISSMDIKGQMLRK